MSQSRILSAKQFEIAWKALPENDRRFWMLLGLVWDVVGDEKLYYRPVSSKAVKVFQRVGRLECYNVMLECLSLMLGAPSRARIRRYRRWRRELSALGDKEPRDATPAAAVRVKRNARSK